MQLIEAALFSPNAREVRQIENIGNVLFLDNTVLCFDDIVFSSITQCCVSVNIVLCLDDTVLCFDHTMLCFDIILCCVWIILCCVSTILCCASIIPCYVWKSVCCVCRYGPP